jgi:hypothetical protein
VKFYRLYIPWNFSAQLKLTLMAILITLLLGGLPPSKVEIARDGRYT